MILIVVWKDKNRFTKKKYGFITPPVIMNNITPDDGLYAVIESNVNYLQCICKKT